MKDITLGYAFCGSFCTIKKSLAALKTLAESGYKIKPIMSQIVYNTDTRFGKAEDLIREVEEICGEKIIHDIAAAEPIGPKNLLDIIVVSPCTGNTAAKIALGITDTPVTMAVKSHIRNSRPVVIAVSTNDALAGAAKAIGLLENYKNYYFVPMRQDDSEKKPFSVVADYTLLKNAVEAALRGVQLQPMIL